MDVCGRASRAILAVMAKPAWAFSVLERGAARIKAGVEVATWELFLRVWWYSGTAEGPALALRLAPSLVLRCHLALSPLQQVSTGTATATGCGGGSAGSCHRVPRASHDQTLPAPCDCRPCRDGRFYPTLLGLVGGTGAVPAPPGSLLSPRCDLRDGDMRTQSLQSL